ncbi:hypothetical protein [Streptomyces sp. MJM8645]|uniref:hypothetical protein n=1 Tax=Streptomycetaceae TaxID=2062 RepID=UPI0007AFB3DA|nr:hypothetical protein [Streptomyces sp. MJM8645]
MTETIECRATRRGREWTVHVPEHGVYSHGKTLTKVGENTQAGLALVGVTAEVMITPVTPELEKVRATKAAHAAAVSEAVVALALRRATTRDIALAVGVPAAQVKRLLAERSSASRFVPAGEPDAPEETGPVGIEAAPV